MKNKKATLLFNEWLEHIISHYGDEDVKLKIESVLIFLKENLQIDDYNNSYLEIKRVHTKYFLWLLLSLIIDYEARKGNPNKHHEFGESNSQKMEMPEEIERKDKYMSLEVDKVFPYQELTEKEVVYIEHWLDKLNVDLESEFKIHYVLSAKHLIHLMRGIMKEVN